MKDAGEADARTAHTRHLRGDIEGLRAVAVGSVLIYHAGLAWTPGGFAGVDVFFVISGFLITDLMLREIDRDGRLRLGRFWARRARRLLPASALVLAFSAVVAVLWLPVTSRKDFGGDIVAAALYLVNWRLGYREVDYLAEDVGASPVQHYWSLAVEEQFYILWPLLIALVVALVAVRRRTALTVTILAVTAASFAWSLHYSIAQPGLSFFVTSTRLWELGVGALLAVVYPRLTGLPRWLREGLGAGGLAAIAVAVLLIDERAVWPGAATLWPVLGAAAVILAGAGGGPTAAGRLLSVRPAVWVGALSYSLYLWHWPLLVAAEGIWGDDLRVRHTIVVVLVSVIPAWLSYRFVETPVRFSSRLAPTRSALALGGALTALAGVVGAAVIASFSLVETIPVAQAKDAPGAAVLADPGSDVDWATVRQVDVLRAAPTDGDLPRIYGDLDCVPDGMEDRQQICEFGDTESEHTVVLVGDSKAMQWFTPMERIAESAGWRLVVMGKGGCEFADVVRIPPTGKPNRSCDRWSQWTLDTVLEMRPDVVVTVTRWKRTLPEGGSTLEEQTSEAMVEGLVRHWTAVVDAGIELVPILDTPGPPGGGGPECIIENRDELTECGYRLAERESTTGAPEQRAAARQVPDARVIDATDLLCPDGVSCPAVIGNVRVYRSGSHISDTYADSTTTILSDRIFRATDGLLGERLDVGEG